MDEMQSVAHRNAMLVHALHWNERRAGIFEPAPTDELAVATTLGLVLNCLSSGLYMASLQLCHTPCCKLYSIWAAQHQQSVHRSSCCQAVHMSPNSYMYSYVFAHFAHLQSQLSSSMGFLHW